MIPAVDHAPPKRPIVTKLPHKLGFLMGMHRYKVAWGGRGGAKSQSFARALLNLGANQKLRILCARETQRSLRESVHRLLVDCVQELGLEDFYTWNDNGIYGANGTEFIFIGLASHTVISIKSYEGVDIVWVEEGQGVSKRSWDMLIPTIRATNSEIWVSFNPELDSDDTYKRFVVRRPPGAIVVKMTYADNPWFPKELEQERVYMRDHGDKLDYDNIWEGNPRSVLPGAIYTREITQMVTDFRIRPMPYNPHFPVHTVWDLGWNDAMAIIMFQLVAPGTAVIINYMEASGRTYAQFVADMNQLGYLWGEHWLPHDAADHDPKSGTNAIKLLRKLIKGKVKMMARTDPEARIRAGRMMFPRLLIDDTARDWEYGFLGANRLLDCLKRYRRTIPKTTDEPASPVHDQYSHGADAFGGMAEIIDQVRNEGDIPPPKRLPGFVNPNRGMGTMG